jgi:hypothetical protein
MQSSNPDRITALFPICLEKKKIQIEFNSTEHFLYVIIRMVQTARLYLSVVCRGWATPCPRGPHQVYFLRFFLIYFLIYFL